MREELALLFKRPRFIFGLFFLGLLFAASNFAVFFLFKMLHGFFAGDSFLPRLEGEGLSVVKIFGPPFAMAGVAVFCLVLEVCRSGWENSSLRRLLIRPSSSARTDLFYFLLSLSGLRPVLALLFSLGIGYGISEWITRTFSVSLFSQTPFFQALAAAVLVNTLLFYWTHRLMHAAALWHIHKVHHSAEELNLITPHRNHPIDLSVSMLLQALPLGILGISFEVVIVYSLFNALYQQLVHSNMDWPGWLNVIFITPQAHRIHHSMDPRHWKKNFGVLTLWDTLFGTYYFPRGEIIAVGLQGETLHNTGKPLAEMWQVYAKWVSGFLKRGVS